MEEVKEPTTKEFALETVIKNVIQIPGVKVDRNKFLAEIFATEKVEMKDVLELGTVQAGCTKEMLARICKKLIFKRTSESSVASFVSGLPGGAAMALTIPADIAQFFGMALRLAQEISYLYGATDIWQNGKIDEKQVKNQLILYCGVMFGVSNAITGVRVLSTQIAKTTLKKLPQKALTKTFWYPIVKQIGKSIGIKVTKSTVAKGASKVIPIIGGVISGGLNFASMMPMANRLQAVLEKASFDYTTEELEKDIEILSNVDKNAVEAIIEEKPKANPFDNLKNGVVGGAQKVSSNMKNMFSKKFVKKSTFRIAPRLWGLLTRRENPLWSTDSQLLRRECLRKDTVFLTCRVFR